MQKNIFGTEYPKIPQNYVWVVTYSFFSCVFSKMNIYCKHSNNIIIKSREWRPDHLLWQKYGPSLFQNQQFLLGSPGPGLCPGQAEVWKAIDHLGARLLDTGFAFRVWLGQTGCPFTCFWLTTSRGSCVSPWVHSAPGLGPWASAHLLSVVLFYDSQSRSLDAMKHEDGRGVSCWSHRNIPGRRGREGNWCWNILGLLHSWLPLLGFSFCITSPGIPFSPYYLLPDISEVLTRPLVWLFWHLPRLWGSLDSSSAFVRDVSRRGGSSVRNSYRVVAFRANVSESKNSNLVRQESTPGHPPGTRSHCQLPP